MSANNHLPPEVGKVQIDALPLLRLVKHVKDNPIKGVSGTVVGQITGVETSSFIKSGQSESRADSVPQADEEQKDHKSWNFLVSDAIPLPAEKKDSYQATMLNLRADMGVQTNPIGWYQSSPTSSFNGDEILTNFFNFFKHYRLPGICIFFDQVVSEVSLKAIKAFTTSPKLLKLFQQKYKASSQTPGPVQHLKIFQFELYRQGIRSSEDLFVQIPIKIKRSYLMQAFLADHVHTKINLGGGILPLTQDFMVESDRTDNEGNVTLSLAGTQESFLERAIELTNKGIDEFCATGESIEKTHLGKAPQKLNKTDFLMGAHQLEHIVDLVDEFTDCNSLADQI